MEQDNTWVMTGPPYSQAFSWQSTFEYASKVTKPPFSVTENVRIVSSVSEESWGSANIFLFLILVLLEISSCIFPFLLTFYFILRYSQLTMVWWFEVNSEGTQLYINMEPFSPKLPFHPGCLIAFNFERVPCAIQKDLVGYPF